MPDFSLILDHPMSKEIISKLVVGSTAKEVCQWLRIKYPDKDQAHLRLTQKVLKEFTDSQYTQYYDQMLADKSIMQNNDDEKSHLKMSAALSDNRFYREKMEELVSTELNLLKTCEMAGAVIHTRMEQMYDLTQQDTADVGRIDDTLIKYLKLFVDTVEKIERMKLSSSDGLIDHNITIQMVQDYLQIYQEVIRESFAEIDPDMANRVMEKLYDKLNNLDPPEQLSQNEKVKMAKDIEAKVISVENSID